MKKTILNIFFLSFFNCLISQNLYFKNKNILLNQNQTITDTINKKDLIQDGINNKHNPIFVLLKSLMFIYQNCISQQLQADCEYYESCSNFSKRCIREHGIFKGILFSGDRIMRCIPNIEDELDVFQYENNKIIDSEYR